jgi:hypothetical protein
MLSKQERREQSAGPVALLPAPPAVDASTPSSCRIHSHAVLHPGFTYKPIIPHTRKAENATDDETQSGCSACRVLSLSSHPPKNAHIQPSYTSFSRVQLKTSQRFFIRPLASGNPLSTFDVSRSDVMQPYVYQPLRQTPNFIRLLQILWRGRDRYTLPDSRLHYTIRRAVRVVRSAFLRMGRAQQQETDLCPMWLRSLSLLRGYLLFGDNGKLVCRFTTSP